MHDKRGARLLFFAYAYNYFDYASVKWKFIVTIMLLC